MRHLLAVGFFLVLGAAGAWAQEDVIKEREQAMKDVGDAIADPFKMYKGDEPFDLAKVQASLKVVIDRAQKLPTLFPESAKTGGGTHALPAIWENKSEFTGLYAKLGKDATDALASIKDEESLKADLPTVLKDCGTCHKTYRAPLN